MTIKKTWCQAPAKIHLIGEHSVVYGEPAIIAAVGLYTKLSLQKSSTFSVRSVVGNFNNVDSEEIRKCFQKANQILTNAEDSNDFTALNSFFKSDKHNFKKTVIGYLVDKFSLLPFSIEEDIEIPIGSGLGSSSSFAVTISEAVNLLFDLKLSLEEVNASALEIESFAHGRPSGGDNSACCYGGLIEFKKDLSGGAPSINSLDSDSYSSGDGGLEGFSILYTEKPKLSTGELVQKVAEHDKSFREEKTSEITKLIDPLLAGLKTKDYVIIANSINCNHQILSDLGVSTPKLDQINQLFQSNGGAAKLCGAGGGGVMLCYHPDSAKRLELVKESGCLAYNARLAVGGVRSKIH